MKNLKSLLSQKLTWTFSNRKMTLKSNDETLVELEEEKSTKATFALNGKNYNILNKGFWNPKTIIENNTKQILVLKRNIFGSKGSIEFENGNHYTFKIRNSPLAKLSFFDMDKKEILYYKLDATYKPKTILNIVDQFIDENELLMLIVIGCYSFRGIVNDDDGSDFLV